MAIIVKWDMSEFPDGAETLETVGRLESFAEEPLKYGLKGQREFWNESIPAAISDILMTLDYYLCSYEWQDDDWVWEFGDDNARNWEYCVAVLRNVADRLEDKMKPEVE